MKAEVSAQTAQLLAKVVLGKEPMADALSHIEQLPQPEMLLCVLFLRGEIAGNRRELETRLYSLKESIKRFDRTVELHEAARMAALGVLDAEPPRVESDDET